MLKNIQTRLQGGNACSTRGFTLAEVLITLSIIGVVAALTIPAISRKFEKQEWITGYKETFSIISQAAKLAIANNGGSLPITSSGFMTAIKPSLKIAKDCAGIKPLGNCFASSYKRLDGTGDINPWSYNNWSNSYTAVTLSNGAAIKSGDVENNTAVCPNDICIQIYFDINGKKGPNLYGKDLHYAFVSTSTGNIKPDYWNNPTKIDKYCPSDLQSCNPDGYFCGESCGARILRGDYGTAY